MKSWGRDWRTEGTADVRDGFYLLNTFCTECCLVATAKKLNEKASLYEGHGFSRAVK
jgi:hypothetical protein